MPLAVSFLLVTRGVSAPHPYPNTFGGVLMSNQVASASLPSLIRRPHTDTDLTLNGIRTPSGQRLRKALPGSAYMRSSPTLASTTYLGRPPQVEVYNGMFVLQAPRGEYRPKITKRGNRQVVTGFSPASRRRLRYAMLEIDTRGISAPTFCTLTFHRPVADRSAWRAHQNWIRAIRHRYPELMFLWRMELQKRGAVHFHTLLWLPLSQSRVTRHKRWEPWLKALWHRVADPESEPHTKHGAMVGVIRSHSVCRGYLAKYVCKEDEARHEVQGRRWGTSRNLPRKPITTLELSVRETILLRRLVRRYLRNRSWSRKRMRGYVLGSPSVRVFVGCDTLLRMLTECLGVSLGRIADQMDFETSVAFWMDTGPGS